MQRVIKNSNPSTYILKFFEDVDRFTIKDARGRIYYYRYLPYGTRSIKVNIPDAGTYYLSQFVEATRKPLDITTQVNRINLPKPERNRDKDYFITHDPNETSSPAIIYTKTGHIITGRNFPALPIPMKIFILLHEIGHFKYKTEKFCDLYAFIEFVKMGYNPSTAMYCLTDYLRRKPENDERIDYLYNQMVNAEIVK